MYLLPSKPYSLQWYCQVPLLDHGSAKWIRCSERALIHHDAWRELVQSVIEEWRDWREVEKSLTSKFWPYFIIQYKPAYYEILRYSLGLSTAGTELIENPGMSLKRRKWEIKSWLKNSCLWLKTNLNSLPKQYDLSPKKPGLSPFSARLKNSCLWLETNLNSLPKQNDLSPKKPGLSPFSAWLVYFFLARFWFVEHR